LDLANSNPKYSWLSCLLNLGSDHHFKKCSNPLKSWEVLLFDRNTFSVEELSSYYYSTPGYGHGKQTVFDFQRLERALALRLLPNVCYLCQNTHDHETRKFKFLGDIGNRNSILERVEQTVHQSPMPKEFRQSIENLLNQLSTEELLSAFKSMEVLLHLMAKAGGNIQTHLEKYLEIFQISSKQYPFFVNDVIGSLELRYVESLYLLLENLFAYEFVTLCAADYLHPLPFQELLLKYLNSITNKDISPIIVADALKLFIVRDLCENALAPNLSLSLFITNPMLYPDNLQSILRDHLDQMQPFPQEITLASTYQTFQFVNNFVQKQADNGSSMLTQEDTGMHN